MGRPQSFRGSVDGSFAYRTVKDRLPSILSSIVDAISQQMHNFPNENIQELKELMRFTDGLRYMMTRNKPLPLTDDSNWKMGLEEFELQERTWFNAPWLFIECYTYFLLEDLKRQLNLDYQMFASLKSSSLAHSVPFLKQIVEHERLLTENKLEWLIYTSLWGNEADLSLSLKYNLSSRIDPKHDFVVLDELSLAMAHINNDISIILDNAGVELFADLQLADYFASQGRTVTLHFKNFEWFVSDVIRSDIDHLFDVMGQNGMEEVVQRWKGWIDIKKWIFTSHDFWTLFRDYRHIPAELKEELKDQFVIFKGDLNYRKMVGDCEWPVDIPFKEAMGCPDLCVLMLRTCKSGAVVGVDSSIAAELDAVHPPWKEDGRYAMIQFHSGFQ
jgi:damage-control phosphatase, subfamily III